MSTGPVQIRFTGLLGAGELPGAVGLDGAAHAETLPSAPRYMISFNNVKLVVTDDDSTVFTPNDKTVKSFFPTLDLRVIDSGHRRTVWSFSGCAGDEVRVEVAVSATWRQSGNIYWVDVHGTMDLFEGASCSTSDLDGQSDFFRTADPFLPVRDGSGFVKNEAEESLDSGKLTYQVDILRA